MRKGLWWSTTPTTDAYYNWTAAKDDTIYSDYIEFTNPQYEVGLWTLLITTTDGGDTPTITPTLQFFHTSGTYGSSHSLTDLLAATTFTSGGKFECRLDSQSWWLYNKGFRIALVRGTADKTLVIDNAQVLAI